LIFQRKKDPESVLNAEEFWKQGGFPPIVQMISQKVSSEISREILLMAAGLLAELATFPEGNCNFQTIIRESGAIVPILKIAESYDDHLIRQSSSVIQSLAANNDNLRVIVESGVVGLLIDHLEKCNLAALAPVQVHFIETLHVISSNETAKSEILSKGKPIISALLKSNFPRLLLSTIKLATGISSNDDALKKEVEEANQHLEKILASREEENKKAKEELERKRAEERKRMETARENEKERKEKENKEKKDKEKKDKKEKEKEEKERKEKEKKEKLKEEKEKKKSLKQPEKADEPKEKNGNSQRK